MKITPHCMFAAVIGIGLAAFSFAVQAAPEQGMPFLYRGHLNLGNGPANGRYDLAFSLFETNQAGTAVAASITNSATDVRNGKFAVTLNFGPGPFTGSNYWLEIRGCPAGNGNFVAQTPRTRLAPSPYAHGPQRLVTSAIQPRQTADNPGTPSREGSATHAAVQIPNLGLLSRP